MLSDDRRRHKTLVTGATGFIGSHLIAKWHRSEAAAFRALCRSGAVASRLRATGCDAVVGDLLDEASIRHALKDCDAIVHLAHGDDETAELATRNLLAQALTAGISRFVHISSISVHGPNPSSVDAHEATATITHYNESYCDSKAGEEHAVREAMLNGLPCVILRPTIVYGPGSHFVRQIVQEAQSGAITLIDEGSGVCNGLYVDDLCEAIEAALHAPAAVGETLFINGDQPVTWGEFVLGFARAVRPDVHVTHLSSKAVLAEIRLRPEPQPLSTASRLVMRSKRLLAKLLRIQGTTKPRPISAGRVARETVAVAFSNAKAKHALAWQPQFDFASGLTATSRWLAATRPYATGK